MTSPTRHRIGIDLGGTKIEGVVLGEHLTEPIFRHRVATPRSDGYSGIVAAVVEMARLMLTHVPGGQASIGIGIPGIVSTTHGRVKNANTTDLIGHALGQDIGDLRDERARVRAGTVTFEAKVRGAADAKFTTIAATNASTLANATTTTANGIFRVVGDGLDVRARMSLYTSGTCVADSSDVEV